MDRPRRSCWRCRSRSCPGPLLAALRALCGGRAELRISPHGHFAAARDAVFHVELTDLDGNPVPYYGGNLVAPHGTATYTLPLARNDKPGDWTVRVHDVLAGATATTRLNVKP